MMKKIFSDKKGITLVSISVAIVVILTLTSILIYNVRDSLKITNLRAMQNDIENLRDKINEYYAETDSIPAKLKYTNTDKLNVIKDAGIISEKVDIGDFYIIELDEIENLTLNYGEDFKQITDVMTDEEASQFEDLYIINETSLNIFYVEGIRVDNDWFYTDYNADKVDTVAVELRYFDGVQIPEGFYYVGGTKEEGIVISDNIEDVNKGTSHEVAKTLKGNQFVWVPVENDNDFKRYAGYYNGTLQDISNYTEPYENGYEEEDLEYNKMLESVLNNNGFYVSRYEAGTTATTARTSGSGITDGVVSRQGAYVYNYISWSENMTSDQGGAVQKAKEFARENGYETVTSTLIYGVQWDAIMQWIDSGYKNEDGTLTSFVADSTGKGNYENSVATTGSNAEYAVKNIYDLAGNVYEWTMESYNTNIRVYRGGGYGVSGSYFPASVRNIYYFPYGSFPNVGFRVALYLNNEEKWSPVYDENGKYVDKNGDEAVIPKGFKVSETPGMNTIDDGLVVQDQNKNEFVWIPVDSEKFDTEFIRRDGYYDGELQTYISNSECGEADGTGINEKYTESETTREEAKKMYESVKKNGGFYIGRYEAGKDSSENVVVQKEADVYNSIKWSANGSMQETTGTTGGAVELARNFDTVNNYANVTSTLIYGVQWDAVIKWMEDIENPNVTGSLNKYIQDSTGMGWYFDNYSKGNSEHKTGIDLNGGRNRVKNIYDLAGNVHEWTMESYNKNANDRIVRGGYYGVKASIDPTSYRANYTPSNYSSIIGFRIALYVD